MKTLGVCGQFNDEGGKPSKIGEIVCGKADKIINGGYFTDLEVLLGEVTEYDIILWFADVPNDKEKIISRVKAMNPHCTLVTSKRNDGNYAIQDLIQRCLKNHSHLLVEFTKVKPVGSTYDGSLKNWSRVDVYAARVLDALGNQFNEWTTDMGKVSRTISQRLEEIGKFSRVGSKSIGKNATVEIDPDFLEVVHQHSLQFHQKIYGTTPIDRFLGNAAFRCPKGFPSFRGEDEIIYMTRRNIDKSMLSNEGFVAVNANSGRVNIPPYLKDEQSDVEYYGDFKPSVDTPIQLGLYRFYKNAKYIIHSHVYADFEKTGEAPTWGDFTTDQKEIFYNNAVIPCGAIEELYKIFHTHPNPDDCNFTVNLKGHGVIVVADNLEFLKSIVYKSRGFPELQEI